MELENLSTRQLNTILLESKNLLNLLEKQLISKEDRCDEIDYEIDDLKNEQDRIGDEIDSIKCTLEETESKIEEIEGILIAQNGCIYSMEELEEAGQMVMFND
jgi:hypothetical protein